MKKKLCVLLAGLTACLSVPFFHGCALLDQLFEKPSDQSYEVKEFLGVEDFGEPTRMPDPYFTWTYYRVVTERMADASEINISWERNIDTREYQEDGELTKIVVQLKTVLYSDYVVESTYTENGVVMRTEKVALVEENGEQKILCQRMDADGKVTYNYESSWNENREEDYHVYLIENSMVDSYLSSNYYHWSYYKSGDIYSCYATEEGQSLSGLYDANNEDVTMYEESEYLIQFKINDSVDRFEKRYEHTIIRLKQDYNGYKTDPYVYLESMMEITTTYGERTAYNK